MTIRYIALMSLGGMLWALPAASHHNSSMHYAMDKEVTLEGVVTAFELVNPHARIYFDVKTSEGETVSWMAEGESASVLRRQDWNNDTLKEGDTVMITGNPSRDGSAMVEWLGITLAGGRELSGGNGQRDERDAFFEQRRRNQANAD